MCGVSGTACPLAQGVAGVADAAAIGLSTWAKAYKMWWELLNIQVLLKVTYIQ